MLYLCLGYETKTVVAQFWKFFNIDLCSATSMESSRRDLLNDIAERRPILKNYQNTYHPLFGFTPKTGITFPKTEFCFYCVKSHPEYFTRGHTEDYFLLYVPLSSTSKFSSPDLDE